MAELRGPSVAEELLEPLAGSKLMVSAATAIVTFPPGWGWGPPVVVDVVVCTSSRLFVGLAFVGSVVPEMFFLVVAVTLFPVEVVDAVVAPVTVDVDVVLP